MKIESILLDGFKTYGVRTLLENFDPNFTAITGKNGSGKSNILDGICFLLGLSKPGAARVSTLKELIYKNGMAGVTKARV
jgi:structural maintenance of chromosome 2